MTNINRQVFGANISYRDLNRRYVRYISLERLIEQNKERYYEVLEQSSQGWHEGKHDPWPTINFLLYILTQACKEFEARVDQVKSPRGAKTELVEHVIESIDGEFGITDLEKLCPGVSRDMIRRLPRDLKAAGRVECLGLGPGAKWRKRVITSQEGNKEGNNTDWVVTRVSAQRVKSIGYYLIKRVLN